MSNKLNTAQLIRYFAMYLGERDNYTFLYCPNDIIRKFDHVKFLNKGVYEMLGVNSWCESIQVADMKKKVRGNFDPSQFKLTLRSLYSMTEEEGQLYNTKLKDNGGCLVDTPESIKWLIDNKFDIYDLEKLGYATYRKYKHAKYQKI